MADRDDLLAWVNSALYGGALYTTATQAYARRCGPATSR